MSSIVIINNEGFALSMPQIEKKTVWWRRILIGWLASQSRSKRLWQRYGTTATGYRVPYRVWLHLGAYLEVNQHTHR